MDLSQIAIAQTKSQNQLCFDSRAFEEDILRREKRRAAMERRWRLGRAAVLKMGESVVFLSKMAQHRVSG